MAKVPMYKKVSTNAYSGGVRPDSVNDYSLLGEGPIHPSQITRNGNVLFNFVNELARDIAATEENERAAAGVMFHGDDRRLGYSIRHSKIHDLERVGQNMQNIMNEGYRQRRAAQAQSNYIQVDLNAILNANKAFDNLTNGYKKPVIQNKYTKEENITMNDIDISDYIGSTPQSSAMKQNNTFYVNMDKTTKALLTEQIKTNKLLGILVQSVRENGVKIDELPQHIAELVASNNLPDAEIMSDDEYASLESSASIDENLLP